MIRFLTSHFVPHLKVNPSSSVAPFKRVKLAIFLISRIVTMRVCGELSSKNDPVVWKSLLPAVAGS